MGELVGRSDADLIFHLFECLLTDPADVRQVFYAAKSTVLSTIVYYFLCGDRTYSGNSLELVGISAVDVDLS